MNISTFFYQLTFVADIEIIIAFLPEMLRLGNQSPRSTPLQRFKRVGQSAAIRHLQRRLEWFMLAEARTYALNAKTGAELWSYTTGGTVDSSPAVANGVVYVGLDDNKVYAFGLK
jgi:hypothetical protein